MIRETTQPWTIAEPHLVRRREALHKAIESCLESIECDESIHKLRVASRRLEAALTSFESLLLEKRLRRVRKRVRQIRRAAGRIRDLDVLILSLHEVPTARKVLPPLREQRRHLADTLLNQLSDRRQRQFRRDLSRLTQERASEPAADPGNWAAERIQPVALRFLQAARNDVHKIRELHQLRLCGKRLRYSLELFRDQLEPEHVSCLLRSLRGIQERLGDMNDHASAHRLLRDVADSIRDDSVREVAEKLARREKRSLKRDRRRFLKWWRHAASDQIVDCIRRIAPVELAVSSV